MVWNETFAKSGRLLEQGKVVAITARVDKREEAARLAASEIRVMRASSSGKSNGNGGPGNRDGEAGTKPVVIRFRHPQTTEVQLREVREALASYPGTRPVQVEFVNGEGKKVRMRAGLEVELCAELKARLGEWLVS